METVGGVAGWPISHAEASSETAAAAEFMGVGRPHFDEPPSWIEPGGVLMARLERWCAEPRLARRHRDEIQSSDKAKFYTGLTCTGVALEPGGGRVAGLRVKDAAGAEVSVRARHHVIAAGGIGAARLLLASDDVEPCGVGGRSGWLGRGYMGHLKGAIADIVLTGLDDAQVDYRRDGDWYVRLRIMLEAATLRAEGLRNISFLPDNPAFADPSHRSGALSAVALRCRRRAWANCCWTARSAPSCWAANWAAATWAATCGTWSLTCRASWRSWPASCPAAMARSVRRAPSWPIGRGAIC